MVIVWNINKCWFVQDSIHWLPTYESWYATEDVTRIVLYYYEFTTLLKEEIKKARFLRLEDNGCHSIFCEYFYLQLRDKTHFDTHSKLYI
jgi:hypothetical protein